MISTGAIIFSNSGPCAGSRGYPSIKKPGVFETFTIAASSNFKTISFGTKIPLVIISCNSFPFSEPDPTSARNKSPVLKCENPYLAIIRSHCVPLPQPGPPSTQIIGAPLAT